MTSHYDEASILIHPFFILKRMDFTIGTMFKYIFRYKYKGSPVDDLNKALWYLNKTDPEDLRYMRRDLFENAPVWEILCAAANTNPIIDTFVSSCSIGDNAHRMVKEAILNELSILNNPLKFKSLSEIDLSKPLHEQ